jgi:hypothetical protein
LPHELEETFGARKPGERRLGPFSVSAIVGF